MCCSDVYSFNMLEWSQNEAIFWAETQRRLGGRACLRLSLSPTAPGTCLQIGSEYVCSRVTHGSLLSLPHLLTGLSQMTRHVPKIVQSDAFLLKEASRQIRGAIECWYFPTWESASTSEAFWSTYPTLAFASFWKSPFLRAGDGLSRPGFIKMEEKKTSLGNHLLQLSFLKPAPLYLTQSQGYQTSWWCVSLVTVDVWLFAC